MQEVYYMSKELPLSALKAGQWGIVTALHTHKAMRRRLQDLGFLPGQRVSVFMHSPLGQPTAYFILGTVIVLRQADAAQIFVQRGE